MTSDVESILTRLGDPAASVRRMAVMDLVKRGGPRAGEVLLQHLARETDAKARIAIVRYFGASGLTGAMPVLAALRDDPRTSAALAHAAILAHDRLERRAASAGG